MLTDGWLWFTDLTSPDPFGILPVVGGFFSLLNVMSSNASSGSMLARKFGKFILETASFNSENEKPVKS